MTHNQINHRKVMEDKRHNEESERIGDEANKLKRKEIRMKERTSYIGTAGNLLGSVAKGVLNDPSWYNLDKALVDSTANLVYGKPLGKSVNTGREYGHPFIPAGFALIRILNCVGPTGANSNMDTAMQNIYTWIRHINSGGANYEAADLIQYLQAADMAYSFYAHLCLVYSLCLSAKQENWYFGKTMVQAMGYDFTSLSENLANLRTTINRFAVQLDSIAVPDTLPLFKRHMWLMMHIWKDAKVKKSQEYIFVPEAIGYYDDVGARVVFTPWCSAAGASHNLQAISNMCNTIIDGFLKSEDAGNISGDVEKAYDVSNLVTLPRIPDDFHVESEFSEEVLSQISAATVCGQPLYNYFASEGGETVLHQLGIYQNPSEGAFIGYGNNAALPIPAMFSVNSTGVTSPSTQTSGVKDVFTTVVEGRIVNMYKDDVTPDDTMVATRLMAAGINFVDYTPPTGSPGEGTYASYSAMGTEIVTTVGLYSYGYVNAGQVTKTLRTFNLMSNVIGMGSLNNAAIERIGMISQFDWAPQTYIYNGATSVTTRVILPMFDLQNFAEVTTSNLSDMHSVAFMSEYAIPLTGFSGKRAKQVR